MADHVDSKKRSEIMASIRSKGTQPELLVRSLIHKRGFRFRLHVKTLPGTPDIVLTRHRKIIFVNGCLWHGHSKCTRASFPKTNRAFWTDKVHKNQKRDQRVLMELKNLGWKVLSIWQCQTRSAVKMAALLTELTKFLEG